MLIGQYVGRSCGYIHVIVNDPFLFSRTLLPILFHKQTLFYSLVLHISFQSFLISREIFEEQGGPI